jgi:hypothetical protein
MKVEERKEEVILSLMDKDHKKPNSKNYRGSETNGDKKR